MEKGCKNHRETLYSSKGKIVYIVGKPCNIYRLRGKPYDTLESVIDVGQGISVGPGRFCKKNKCRALNKRRACKVWKKE